MQLNYYFLKQLTARLNQKLAGFTIATCFSQEKDELVIGLENGREEFYVKAILTSTFTSLSFPPEFHRKRRNVVDLFPEMLGKTVQKVTQHLNERSFYFTLSDGYILLFKLFGNRSNIILFQNEEPLVRFHKKFPDDFNLVPLQMDRHLPELESEYPLTLPRLQKLWPTLGELPIAWLKEIGFTEKSAEEQKQTVGILLEKLNQPNFYVVAYEGKIRLSLLPLGQEIARFEDPVEAAQFFTIKYLSDNFFQANFLALKQQLEKQLHTATSVLEHAENRHRSLLTDSSFSQTADIIMANLTNIPPRAEEAELYDFYLDRHRVIKLKANETPQKTAERLYKKSKNQQIELKILEEKALAKTAEIFELEEKLSQLHAISDAKALKQFLKENELSAGKKSDRAENLFREFAAEGFKILVGKSAANNDLLTQKHAHKDDLWLHAKDVSGSHVIVKFKAGKPFPLTVIEKAAQLAAYYSKRKTDSLCPVSYTPKKFVRKPKGAAAGSVIVEREKVILVKPENPFERTF